MFGMYLLVFFVVRVVEKFLVADFTFIRLFFEVHLIVMLPV